MRAPASSYPTNDEIISMLIRSNIPTLVSEGRDDAVVLRIFEKEFSDVGLSLLPVGGRSRVLQIYERRNELRKDQIVLFLADKDTWCITGIPPEYIDDCIMFTSGYSIENDLYVDSDFEKLLSTDEEKAFFSELDFVCDWYSIMLNRKLRGQEAEYSAHPDNIMDNRALFCKESLLSPNEEFPIDLRNNIRERYKNLLRGKTLLSLIMRHLSYKGRDPRHHHLSLMEMSAASMGNNMSRIRDRLDQALRR